MSKVIENSTDSYEKGQEDSKVSAFRKDCFRAPRDNNFEGLRVVNLKSVTDIEIGDDSESNSESPALGEYSVLNVERTVLETFNWADVCEEAELNQQHNLGGKLLTGDYDQSSNFNNNGLDACDIKIMESSDEWPILGGTVMDPSRIYLFDLQSSNSSNNSNSQSLHVSQLDRKSMRIEERSRRQKVSSSQFRGLRWDDPHLLTTRQSTCDYLNGLTSCIEGRHVTNWREVTSKIMTEVLSQGEIVEYLKCEGKHMVDSLSKSFAVNTVNDSLSSPAYMPISLYLDEVAGVCMFEQIKYDRSHDNYKYQCIANGSHTTNLMLLEDDNGKSLYHSNLNVTRLPPKSGRNNGYQRFTCCDLLHKHKSKCNGHAVNALSTHGVQFSDNFVPGYIARKIGRCQNLGPRVMFRHKVLESLSSTVESMLFDIKAWASVCDDIDDAINDSISSGKGEDNVAAQILLGEKMGIGQSLSLCISTYVSEVKTLVTDNKLPGSVANALVPWLSQRNVNAESRFSNIYDKGVYLANKYATIVEAHETYASFCPLSPSTEVSDADHLLRMAMFSNYNRAEFGKIVDEGRLTFREGSVEALTSLAGFRLLPQGLSDTIRVNVPIDTGTRKTMIVQRVTFCGKTMRVDTPRKNAIVRFFLKNRHKLLIGRQERPVVGLKCLALNKHATMWDINFVFIKLSGGKKSLIDDLIISDGLIKACAKVSSMFSNEVDKASASYYLQGVLSTTLSLSSSNRKLANLVMPLFRIMSASLSSVGGKSSKAKGGMLNVANALSKAMEVVERAGRRWAIEKSDVKLSQVMSEQVIESEVERKLREERKLIEEREAIERRRLEDIEIDKQRRLNAIRDARREIKMDKINEEKINEFNDARRSYLDSYILRRVNGQDVGHIHFSELQTIMHASGTTMESESVSSDGFVKVKLLNFIHEFISKFGSSNTLMTSKTKRSFKDWFTDHKFITVRGEEIRVNSALGDFLARGGLYLTDLTPQELNDIMNVCHPIIWASIHSKNLVKTRSAKPISEKAERLMNESRFKNHLQKMKVVAARHVKQGSTLPEILNAISAVDRVEKGKVLRRATKAVREAESKARRYKTVQAFEKRRASRVRRNIR
jgi:hypothetical protein